MNIGPWAMVANQISHLSMICSKAVEARLKRLGIRIRFLFDRLLGWVLFLFRSLNLSNGSRSVPYKIKYFQQIETSSKNIIVWKLGKLPSLQSDAN